MPGSRTLKARRHVLADIDLQTILKPADPNEVWCGVKVVATLGPACHDVETLCGMLDAGMTVARVDLTWGDLKYHLRTLELLQMAMKLMHQQCAIMVNTVGRELIIRRPYTINADGWPVHNDDLTFQVGQNVVITTRAVAASSEVLPISYDKFPLLVHAGDTIYCGSYLNCGAPDEASLYLQVVQVEEHDVVCQALNNAVLHGLITVFNAEPTEVELTALQSDLPLVTAYDLECLAKIAEHHEVDFVATSYTRTGAEVAELRAVLSKMENLSAAEIVTKVETRQGVFNFKGILEQSDAVVLGRGNLGLDIVPEKQAGLQKALITACNVAGKPCAVTRVLDSMIDAPRPTRAEATDVANIVLDGADAIFLGVETLKGKHPILTVRTVVSIARQAEHVFDYQHNFEYLMQAALDAQQARAEDEDDDLCAGLMLQEDIDLYPPIVPQVPPPIPASAAVTAAQPPLQHTAHSGAGAGRSVSFLSSTSSRPPSRPPSRPASRSPSGTDLKHADLGSAIAAMTRFHTESARPYTPAATPMEHGIGNVGGGIHSGASFSSGLVGLPGTGTGMVRSATQARMAQSLYLQSPYLSKLESIASSAVRAAEKVGASLIVVFTHTSRAPQLVAKYRPPMPILTLVVPRLSSDGLHWKLEGRHHARQCLLRRGLMPMLTAPGPSGDEVLEEAVAMAAKIGLVQPHNHIVVVERINESFCVKIVAVDELGFGIKKPGTSNQDLATAAARATLPPAPVVGRTLSVQQANGPGSPHSSCLAHATSGALSSHNSFLPNSNGRSPRVSSISGNGSNERHTTSTFESAFAPGPIGAGFKSMFAAGNGGNVGGVLGGNAASASPPARGFLGRTLSNMDDVSPRSRPRGQSNIFGHYNNNGSAHASAGGNTSRPRQLVHTSSEVNEGMMAYLRDAGGALVDAAKAAADKVTHTAAKAVGAGPPPTSERSTTLEPLLDEHEDEDQDHDMHVAIEHVPNERAGSKSGGFAAAQPRLAPDATDSSTTSASRGMVPAHLDV